MNLAKSLEENKSQAVETLKELIRIKSDAGDPVTTASGEVFPFGQGVQDAFAYMRETEAEQRLRDGSLARARAAKMKKFRSR